MKLSERAKINMKHQMVSEIYQARINKLLTTKEEYIRKNHELYLESINHLLKDVPENLLVKGTSLKMSFTYNEQTINWYATTEKPVICPLKLERYNNTPMDIPMDSSLENSVIPLYEELLDLSSKKDQFEKYLEKVFDTYSGPVQLKKVLPEYLHKYIPLPVARKPRKPIAAKSELAEIKVPDFVKEQLVENLLENN